MPYKLIIEASFLLTLCSTTLSGQEDSKMAKLQAERKDQVSKLDSITIQYQKYLKSGDARKANGLRGIAKRTQVRIDSIDSEIAKIQTGIDKTNQEAMASLKLASEKILSQINSITDRALKIGTINTLETKSKIAWDELGGRRILIEADLAQYKIDIPEPFKNANAKLYFKANEIGQICGICLKLDASHFAKIYTQLTPAANLDGSVSALRGYSEIGRKSYSVLAPYNGSKGYMRFDVTDFDIASKTDTSNIK